MLVIKISAFGMGEHHERLGAATSANLEAEPSRVTAAAMSCA